MSRLELATERGLFSGGLVISLGLHAALAAVVLLWGGYQKPPLPPVLTVSLVAPDAGLPGPDVPPALAGAQSAQVKPPGTPSAPQAKPATPPPKSDRKPKKPKAQPVLRTKPEKDLPSLPEKPLPPSLVQIPKPSPPEALRPASPPSPSNLPGSSQGSPDRTVGTDRAGAGSGPSSSAVLGYGQGRKGGRGNPVAAQSQYLKLVRARILAKRQYPYLARQRHQEGVVHLRFTLSPAGTLSQGVQVVKPSGFELLDEQARQCVLAAAPFPPFPLDLNQDRLTLELPIIYRLAEIGR